MPLRAVISRITLVPLDHQPQWSILYDIIVVEAAHD